MVEFILNDRKIKTSAPSGMLLVDFIRDSGRLKGTKTACREGDCGSCAVLEGKLAGGSVKYCSIASCITPLGNVHGKHVVTIEGLNSHDLTPIQKELADAAAIQCGYCTPGIVMSVTAYALSSKTFDMASAIDAIGGNICRCTGYKSIEKAIGQIITKLQSIDKNNRMNDLIDLNFIPVYFYDIPQLLSEMHLPPMNKKIRKIVGGGTDLFVQVPDTLLNEDLFFISRLEGINLITKQDNLYCIGAACSISDIDNYPMLNNHIPSLKKAFSRIGSKLIRNMATIGGNIVNASPIGDLSIIFLALNASLKLATDTGHHRQILLNQFFKGYKKIDLCGNEYIQSVDFEIPEKGFHFNFEKVSKREYLDIATVNSAIGIQIADNVIVDVHVSMGGIAPVPFYLNDTCRFLRGKELENNTIVGAAKVLLGEICPIDDVRGSAAYKSLLARQLFFAHFIQIFQGRFDLTKLINSHFFT
jgi:xanthine dehydrogenase small subunit